MTHDEMIAVIQAHKDGKVIQFRCIRDRGDWMTKKTAPNWNFDAVDYRAKPEPKEYWLVPYKGRSGFTVFENYPLYNNRTTAAGCGIDFSRVIHVVTVEELTND
jgi:hypothetical protein